MFNSPEMAKPKSTLAHWDTAVGEINAIVESGMSMSEVLVYFKLHKFQLVMVKKVKLWHKIRFPGRPNINLEEAMALMNWVTAEEVKLKKDSVAIDQTQLQNTFKQQNGGKNHNPYKTNKNIRATNKK